MKSKITDIISDLFHALNVKHNKSALEKRIQTHPDYPSLQGITGILNEYKVENIAFRATLEQLNQVQLPILLFMQEQNGTFALLHSITDTEAVVSTEMHSKKKYSIEQFTQHWSGIAVLAEASENSKEPELITEAPNTSYAPQVAIAIFALILLTMPALSSSPLFLLLLAIKTAGLAMVSLLAAHELGVDTALTNKLCSLTKSTGCNEVLKSKAASLFGKIKLADIGLIYFTSTLLTLAAAAIFGHAANVLPLLSWLAVLSLPFVLFSVIYQLTVIKKWCPFCMGVATMLVLEAISALLLNGVQLAIPAPNAISAALLFTILTSIAWMLIKPLLNDNIRLENFENLYIRLKRKPEVLKGLLSENAPISIAPFEAEVILGNPNAKLVITEVVNPFCRPCANSFSKLHSLLNESNSQVRVNLRFLVANNREHKAFKVAAHLISLAKTLPETTLREAVLSWFTHTDYDKWIAQYPAAITEEDYKAVELQNHWAESLGINATPTIYVNGHRWKLDMDLYDLKYSVL